MAGHLLPSKKAEPPAAFQFPSKINIVLDTSASMQGYFKGQTEFKDTVSRLVSALDKLEKDPTRQACPTSTVFQYATDSGSIVSTDDDSRAFIQKLLNNDLKGQDSLLQEMFRSVVAESTGTVLTADKPAEDPSRCQPPSPPSTLSILVTDSIFSYPDSDIERNPTVNKENVEGLASAVQLIFNNARTDGKSVSVLALKSQFHGTYYDYQNDKVTWGTTPRPYYLWMIGPPQDVLALREFLESENVAPIHTLDFGAQPFDFSPVILQYTDREGIWHRYNGENPKRIRITRAFPDEGKDEKRYDSDREVRFAVAVDLSRLSSDQLSPDYLASHIKVESQSPDLRIKKVTIKSRTEIESELDKEDRADIPRSTHLIIVTTDVNFTKTASLTISLEDGLPPWYLDWSNDDDTKKDPHTMGSTFALRHFVEGIAQAYHAKGPIATTTIDLER